MQFEYDYDKESKIKLSDLVSSKNAEKNICDIKKKMNKIFSISLMVCAFAVLSFIFQNISIVKFYFSIITFVIFGIVSVLNLLLYKKCEASLFAMNIVKNIVIKEEKNKKEKEQT